MTICCKSNKPWPPPVHGCARGEIVLLLAICCFLPFVLPSGAGELITNLHSFVGNYQYVDDFDREGQTDGGIQSFLVGYLYPDNFGTDALRNGGIISPIVSYHYFDSQAEVNLQSAASLPVSFFYRGSQLTKVILRGPHTIEGGSSDIYQCIAIYADGTSEDVSSSKQTAFFANQLIGTPFSAAKFIGNRLHTIASPERAELWISATFKDHTGSKTSEQLFATIIPPFSVQIAATIGDVQNVDGIRRSKVTLRAIPSRVPTSSIDFRWDLGDDDGQFDNQRGDTVSGYLANGRTHLVGVEAKRLDSPGVTTARLYITLNKENSDSNEPVTKSAIDVFAGAINSIQGQPLTLEDLTNGSNGLLVIIHGFCATATDDWVKTMAAAIHKRLLAAGIAVPAIALYDWKEMADPDKFEGTSTTCPPTFLRASDEIISQDIKNYAMAQGHILADWISRQLQAGLLSQSKPIHLIGHSAGGFVAGECATLLKEFARDTSGPKIQVTMLDTPHPVRRHISDFRGPGRVERYISSCLGSFAPWVDGSGCLVNKRFPLLDCEKAILDLALLYHGIAYLCLPAIEPDQFYYRAVIPDVPSTALEAHEFSHEWYLNTIDNAEKDGFWYSPWLDNPFPTVASSQEFSVAGSSETTQPLQNFEVFGHVTHSNTSYRICENSDAGIFKTVTFPVGAETLRFRYQFATSGDGDFLSVHWGSNVILYVGLDTSLSEHVPVSAEVNLPITTNSNVLTFKLVSRGCTNAVLIIDRVELKINLDPDGDGLLTMDEARIGTNPLLYDTDGDGISDGEEVVTNVLNHDTDGDGLDDGDELKAGTDPTRADSVLQIVGVHFTAPSTARIDWRGVSNHTYRVIRSNAIDRKNYEVLTNNLQGGALVMQFCDTTATNQTDFFWIETDN